MPSIHSYPPLKTHTLLDIFLHWDTLFKTILGRISLRSLEQAQWLPALAFASRNGKWVPSGMQIHMQVSQPVMPASLHLIYLIYPKLPMYWKPGTTKSATGLSYLTNTLDDGCLIRITDSPHKSTLCREGVTSCLSFHLHFQSTGTTGSQSWISIWDEKVHMRMRIQDHWACP